MSILKYFQSVSQTQDVSQSQATPGSMQDLPSTDPTESGAQATSTGQDEDDNLEESECTPPSPKQSCIDSVPESHDLARCVGSTTCLSNAEKYELLANPFRPGADYRFPKNTTGRALSFQ